VLSGCIGAQIPSLILQDRAELRLKDLARWFRDEFEGRFFIEVMAHGSTGGVDHVVDRVSGKSETWLNDELVDIADRIGVGIVATNDAHYLERVHGQHHDTLLCIGMGKYKEEADRMRFPGSQGESI
jgi:DNA polymerase-3 subunit alpha